MTAGINALIYFGALVSVCGVATVQTVGLSTRKPGEVAGIWGGSFVAGAIGFLAASLIAFAAGFVPFIAPGNPTAMAAVIYGGTALFAWPGAKVGLLWTRYRRARSRWPY